MTATFLGYRCADGRVGVRGYVAVIPASVASSSVARGVADATGAWARTTPQLGTSQPDETRAQTERTLAGIGRNPKVGAALVVELGTDDVDVDARTATADDLLDRVLRTADGDLVCAERHGLTEFAITRVGPSM